MPMTREAIEAEAAKLGLKLTPIEDRTVSGSGFSDGDVVIYNGERRVVSHLDVESFEGEPYEVVYLDSEDGYEGPIDPYNADLQHAPAPSMSSARIAELRFILAAESISYGELTEIQSEFDLVPDSFLPEPRENAMASDMLDMIESYTASIATSAPTPRPITQPEYAAIRDLTRKLIDQGVEPETIIDAVNDENQEN